MTLLTVRNLKTLIEEDIDKISEWAKTLEVKAPKRYKAKDINACKRIFKQLNDDEEGLVILDCSTSKRLKLKQESYIKLMRIKMLKEQDIFNYILGKDPIERIVKT